MSYPFLFQPIRLGRLTLKNRLVMSPMTMNYASPEGYATERLIRYYEERALGGVGLIIVEGTFFSAEGRGYVRQLGIPTPQHVTRLRVLTDRLHQAAPELKVLLQIHHAGWRASSHITGCRPVGPSGLAAYPNAEPAHELTREEIRGLVDAHVQAAVRAEEAGFDGVDLHCAHGYLIPSFLSPLSNRRADHYGGTLEARARFLLEILRGTRERLGRQWPLTIKISAEEYLAGGLGLKDMARVTRWAEEAGIDGVMVSAGSVGGEKIGDLEHAHQLLRTLPMMTSAGCLVPLAEHLKGHVQIPVITVGRIHTPELAEVILGKGQADMVAMGRPLLADPHLPTKASAGRTEDIRPCISCNEGCYRRIFQQQDILCSVNPSLGREAEALPSSAPRPKRVVVVGAGPAGLEAARAAWEAGHAVTVVERSSDLGGQLRLACLPPGRKDIERFRLYLIHRLRNSGVRLVQGQEASAALVAQLDPEKIILATGARPRLLTIPGLELRHSATAWEVLGGETTGEEPFLVLGAGLVGCEIADHLSEQGKEVLVVELLDRIAADGDADTQTYFRLRFEKNGVPVFLNSEIQEVRDRLAVIRQGKEKKELKFGTLVFAVGAEPHRRLHEELQARGYSPVTVGDCQVPRNILEAVREGFEAGRNI